MVQVPNHEINVLAWSTSTPGLEIWQHVTFSGIASCGFGFETRGTTKPLRTPSHRQRFAITGTLSYAVEHGLRQGALRVGASLSRRFDPTLDAVILGHSPSALWLEKAKLHGVPCLSAVTVTEMLDCVGAVIVEPVAADASMTEVALSGTMALAQMRALVYQPPSVEGWKQLCTLLGRMEPAEHALAVDYLRDHTRDWPSSLEIYEWCALEDAELRVAHSEQRASLLRGQVVPGGSLLRVLRYTGMGLGDALAEPLLRATGLEALRLLDVSDNGLSSAFFGALGGSRAFPALTHLNVSFNQEEANAAAQVALGGGLETLRYLTLRSTWLETLGCVLLARAKHWEALRWLDLRGNGLGDQGLAALATAPWIEHLTYLNLSDTQLQDHGVPSFLRDTRCDALEHLDLSHNSLGGESGKALAQATSLRKLTYLNLRNSCLHEDSGVALLAASHWESLRWLDLFGSVVGGAALSVLARAPWSGLLEHLDVGDSAQVTEDVVQWAETAPLAKLRMLNLSRNPLDDRVALALAARTDFRPQNLNLDHTRIGDEGVRALLEAPQFRAAERLILPWRRVTLSTLRDYADSPRINKYARVECGLELIARR